MIPLPWKKLRSATLRAGSGRVGAGYCAELRPPDGRRLGAVYLEAPSYLQGSTAPDDDLARFLEAAGQILTGTLGASIRESRTVLGSTPSIGSKSTRTRNAVRLDAHRQSVSSHA